MGSTFRQPRHPALNWQALRRFHDVLVRRSALPEVGHDQWVIAARTMDGPALQEPLDEGAWAGHLCFDHPDVIDRIRSRFPPRASPVSRWWRPEFLLQGEATDLRVSPEMVSATADEVLRNLQRLPDDRSEFHTRTDQETDSPPRWERRTSKHHYLAIVSRLLEHIQQGDIYEVNYCTERTAILPGFDPYAAFDRLLERTDAPFAAFYRHGDHYALCMSPEHFLRVEGGRIVTRPMKGTRRRSPDSAQDAALVLELANDPKERSENIMAVDVARHDLSRVAASGSVRVEELCAVKSYPNVHQLVSTVTADLRSGLHTWDAVRAAFPMASMTGAPKRSALHLIDAVEDMPRGLFSGSLGYRLPDGTLDLNVVIRTITYDGATGRASLITGSAITALSDPDHEWEECELKAMSVLNALGHAG